LGSEAINIKQLRLHLLGAFFFAFLFFSLHVDVDDDDYVRMRLWRRSVGGTFAVHDLPWNPFAGKLRSREKKDHYIDIN